MKIRDLVREKCSKCGCNGKVIQEEAYGCDNCRKIIDLSKPEADYLKVDLFFQNHTEHLQFCCWKCLFKKCRGVTTDYFISLPFLKFDTKKPGLCGKDFWKHIKK
jgi:hypothetical protein